MTGGVLLFSIITLATSSLYYNADGADAYGFPFNFYRKVSGYNMVSGQQSTATDFKVLALIGDFTFAFLASWGIFKLINKLRKKGNV